MKLSLIAFCVLMPGAAMAGTNLPALADYPGPNCAKPGEKPELPPDAPKVASAGKSDVQAYNKEVAEFNIALHDYVACRDAYVANAQADMDWIRDQVNKFVAESGARGH